jgi:hypothetical protein
MIVQKREKTVAPNFITLSLSPLSYCITDNLPYMHFKYNFA